METVLAQLQATCPPDLRVGVDGCEEGYDELEEHIVSVREIRLGAGKKWREGQRRDFEVRRTPGSAVVNTLLLQRTTES